MVLPPRRSAGRTKGESARRHVGPSSPFFATPPRLGQPGGGRDSGGSHTEERGAPSRGTPLAVVIVGLPPVTHGSLALPPRLMVAELAEATTSPRLRILMGHPPAAYPLDRCAYHKLGDLLGSPTRAHPRSVSSRLHNPHPCRLLPRTLSIWSLGAGVELGGREG
jgi:hypothetical protein